MEIGGPRRKTGGKGVNILAAALAAFLHAADPGGAAIPPPAPPAVKVVSEADRLADQGIDLIFGEVAVRDLDAGRALLEQAAARGSPAALNALAIVHERGLGVPPDAAKASDYMERAAAAGDVAAQLNLGIRLNGGRDRAQQKRGFDLLSRAAADGRFGGIALGWLAEAYLFGRGVEVDVGKGVGLLLAADGASEGDAAVPFLLGRAYEDGWEGVEPDPVKAAGYFRRAADLGHPRSAWKLGMAYLNGEGVEQNLRQAATYVKQAAEAGEPDGQISMAVMLALGQGIPEDDAKARTWYRRAAEQGSAHALRGLAFMLLTGEGGQADPVTGTAYAELAQEAGDEPAGELLKELGLKKPTAEERRRIDAFKADWRRSHAAPE